MNLKVINTQKEYDLYELLGLTWNFYTNNFFSLLNVALISYFLCNLFIITLPDVDIKGIFSFSGNDKGYLSFYLSTIFFVTSLSNLPIIVFTFHRLKNKDVDFVDTYKLTIAKFIKNILINVGTIALFFTCFFIWVLFSLKWVSIFIVSAIPVVMMLLFFSFTVIAFASKEVNIWLSFAYSFRVAHSKWVKVLLYYIFIYFLSAIVSMAISIPYTLFSRSLFTELIFNTIVNVFCSFFVILMTFLFINLDNSIKK